MAHELEINADGTANMFSGEGLTPRHSMGTVIEGLATAEEALQLAGLDWNVHKRPVYQQNADGLFVPVPDRFSAVRDTDEKSLGIVSKNYHVFQNEEAFSFLNKITDSGSGDAVFSTAGSLFGGSRTFVTLKIGDTFMVGDDDAHDLYLMVTNSHDGSQAFTATVTPIRAVCNNTVTMALSAAKTKWSLRHKTALSDKVANARETLELSFKYSEEFEKAVADLMEIEITKSQFHSIVDKIVPESKTQHDHDVDALMHIWETEDTVKMGGGEGNGWGAFNAVTYFADHGKAYRTAESKFKSIIGTGTNAGFGERLRPAAYKAIKQFA